MSKLIPLDEAARMLGVSVDRLTEMRSNNEIFGYRDGATWKFKEQELERVAGELGVSLGGEGSADDDDDFELSDSSGDDSLELLADSSNDLLLDDSGDELSLGDSSADLNVGSNVLDDDDELLFGGSSLKLAAQGGKAKDPANVLDKDNPPKDPRSSTGKLMAAMKDSENDDDPLALAPMEDDMELVGNDSSSDSSELGSDFEDSEIVLDDSDSADDLVLDSSDNLSLDLGSDSDLVLASSLDAGGDIDSLELAADDDVLSLGDMADPDAATMMQEDDFNLAPMEESDADESSGSQVIALEDSDLFADSGVDPLSESGEGLDAAELVDDDGMEPAYADDFGAGNLAGVGMSGAGVAVGKPEVPYSMMQVLSLGAVALVLAIGCTLLWDIARNLWYPDNRVVQNGLLQIFLDMMGISG